MSLLDNYMLPGRPTRQVQAPSGLYRGVYQHGCYIFRGIRYAKADRFQKPIAVTNVQTPDLVAACPQIGLPFKHTDENCLSLNIYMADTTTTKPVLIYIHGGAFDRGSNSDMQTQGHRLAKNLDLVVVTVNYRLGVFGFFDFSQIDPMFSANPAILDLLLALQFVKKNIVAFGGDPLNITLMGESAGGSLAAMLSTIVDDDSFHKVILSSPVTTAFISNDSSRKRTDAFLAHLNTRNPKILIDIPAASLVDQADAFSKTGGRGITTFSPAVDGDIIKTTSMQGQRDKIIRPRPTWIGVTADEMSILTLPMFAERWQIDKFLPQEMALERDNFENEMRRLYSSIYDESDLDTQIYSDIIIRITTAWYAAEAARHQQVWLYKFDYSGPLVTRTGLKAFHSIDLYYLFDTLPAPLRIPSNQQMVKRIQDDLKQFLYDSCLPWPQAGNDCFPAKHYKDPPEMNHLIQPDIYDFWRNSRHYANRFNPGFSKPSTS